MDFNVSVYSLLVTITSSLLILALSLSGPTSVHSAPTGVSSVPSTPVKINTQLSNVSVQIDSPDSVSGEVRVSLAPVSHHLANISRLWPMFVHAHANIKQDQPSAYFAVIGIHSHQRNVSFCERVGSGRYRPVLNGTNLGLVWKLGTDQQQQFDQQLLCLYNAHSAPLNVLLRLNLYDNSHPIPGGCNIEFALENSPFIIVHRRSTLSSFSTGPLTDFVEFQPAALGSEASSKGLLPSRLRCGQLSRARLRYEVYAHYGWDAQGDPLEEENQYFRSIIQMSSRKWLQKHGTLIHRISHHYHPKSTSMALAPLSSSSTDSPFLRLFIITSLNQQIYFNIVVIDEGDDEAAAATLEFTNNSKVVSKHPHHLTSSLYVPSQITSHVSLSNYAQLFTSLSALSLFSLVVSIIGFRHFILELFYFTFLLCLGLLLCVGSRTQLFASDDTPLLPGDISPWLLIGCTTVSLLVATAWSEFCRLTRNLKCAFCGHSLTLAIASVAITGDVFISLPVTSTLLLTGHAAHYLYYISVLSILLCHGLFILYLDYFWLSALSSSFTTVYFLLLPLDLYFFSGILYRILFQLYLVLTQFSANASTAAATTVTFINFSSRDVFLLVLFTLLVSGSVYWQLISKLASKGYGFGCMAPVTADKSANMSSVSSIVTNLKLQVQPSKIDQEIVKLKMAEERRNYKKRRNKRTTKLKLRAKLRQKKRSKLALSLNCGCTGNNTRKSSGKFKRSKSNLPCSSSSSSSSSRSQMSTKTKLYRCKHCQKYSTTRFSSTSKKLRNKSCTKLEGDHPQRNH